MRTEDDVDNTLLDDSPAIHEEDKMNLGPSENKRYRRLCFASCRAAAEYGSFSERVPPILNT